MDQLAELIAGGDRKVLGTLIGYAVDRGYAKYTSTLEEAWRLSVSTISALLIKACRELDGPPELSPDKNLDGGPLPQFGIMEAQRHRERGVDIEMFLGLLKYYRQSYQDLLMDAGFEELYREKCRRFLDRFFDRIELGIFGEWTKTDKLQLIEELRTSNRFIINEKNKFLTVFESLPHPVIILNPGLEIEHANHAAMEMLYGENVPGSQYYCVMQPRELTDDECLPGTPLARIFPTLFPAVVGFSTAAENTTSIDSELETVAGPRHFEVKLSKMLDVSEKFLGIILIFIDDTERLNSEKYLLESRARYRGVTDCVHALRLFSARPREFDLIITDHTMPKMTGVELCREILRIRPEMPIILCTGYNEAFTKRCAVNPGIRFLIKPFDMRQISELVREVLDMERA